MALYRFVNNVVFGEFQVKRGSIILDRDVKNAERLLGLGVIELASPPPLDEWDGWDERADVCAAHGVTDMEAVLKTPDDEMAAWFGVDAKTVRRWKRGMTQMLVLDDRCCGGRD